VLGNQILQDPILGDFDTGEQVRMFLKTAAGGQDDDIKLLQDLAPRYEYETRDLVFTHGAIEAYFLSTAANADLKRIYTPLRT
jgi:hypothetical protein